MYLKYSLVEAQFPSVRLGLKSEHPGELLWDCHHGDLFVIKAANLAVSELPLQEQENFIRIDINLTTPGNLLAAMEEMAARHQLTFDAATGTLPEVAAQPLLAACHVPAAKLFIYSETAELRARTTRPEIWQLEIRGGFKSRTVPSQETDVLIQMDKDTSRRLLSHLYYLVHHRL